MCIRDRAGTVEGQRQPALGRIKHETIAANPCHVRLDEAEHGGRRNRGVDGVAAVAQHIDGSHGRERMRGRRHRLTNDGRGTAWPLKVLHRLLFKSCGESERSG